MPGLARLTSAAGFAVTVLRLPGHGTLPSMMTIALGSLTRLRSNPFWALIDSEIDALVADDLSAPGQRP